MDKFFCLNCGGEISSDAAYCSYCGAKVPSSDSQDAPSHSSNAHIDSSHKMPHPQKLKHSGFGIASFVMGIFVGSILFISIIAAGFAVADRGVNSNDSIFVVIGMFICGGVVLHLLGILLGVVGFAQRNKNQIFSILGTAINVLAILAVIGLIIIGNSIP